MNKSLRIVRLYRASEREQRLSLLMFLQESFFLSSQKITVRSSRIYKRLDDLDRIFEMRCIEQDSCCLEVQTRIFFRFLSKETCLECKTNKNLVGFVKISRIWKERGQDHRLMIDSDMLNSILSLIQLFEVIRLNRSIIIIEMLSLSIFLSFKRCFSSSSFLFFPFLLNC